MSTARPLHPEPAGRPAPAARHALEEALFEVKRVIVGQDAMLERLLVALLAGGHVLLEGVPGLAKTLTVKTVAEVLGGTFKRVQFTPDLVPSDLVGTRVYHPDTGSFDVELGPVFGNFLLADEINRAPAKVQSALLEVMQERQVTIGGTSFPVPDPFLVLATQNPIESEGTYVLPEAQTDRFLFKLLVGYPSRGEEAAVVGRSLGPTIRVRELLSPAALLAVTDQLIDVWCSTADLERRLSACPSGRGAARARAALAIADPRSESPMESVLRWLLHDARLPPPVLQHAVRNQAGRFLGRADLAWPDRAVLVEFDGNVHRERDVFVNDLRRQNELVAAGWTVLRFSSADVLGHPEKVVAAVRRALS